MEPSLFSQFYSGPLSVQRTVTIRAIAWDANFENSWEADPIQVIIVPVYSLAIRTDGGGVIGVSPTNGPYLSNTLVTIAAIPDPGWGFMQWLGAASGTGETNMVLMSRDKCVEAGSVGVGNCKNKGIIRAAGRVAPQCEGIAWLWNGR